MAITVSYDPLLPLSGQAVTLNTDSQIGTDTDWSVTTLPRDSKIRSGNFSGNTIVPDLPGAYTLLATDVTRNFIPPAYDGDPLSHTVDTSVGTTSITVYVASVLSRTIGVAPHQVDLTLLVQNDTVRGCLLENPRSDAARFASGDTTVLLKLNACLGVTVSALDDSLMAKVGDAITKYDAHIVKLGGTHQNADDGNSVALDRTPTTNEGAIAVVNSLRTALPGHTVKLFQSDGESIVHDNVDTNNLLVAGTATDLASGHALFDNWWAVFESHRVLVGSPPVHHTTADTTNTLTAQKPLASFQSAFIAAALSASLSTPSGEQSGSVLLVNAHGFAGR